MKSKTLIGVWNVRTLTDPGKLEQLLKEFQRFKLDIMGISECRWKGFGESKLEKGAKLLFSGRDVKDSHRDGVGLLLSSKATNSLLDWKPINERIMWCRLFSRARNVTIIQTYAPTESAIPEDKDAFYDQLASVVNNTHKKDIFIVMGNLNAKIGSSNSNLQHVIGKHGLGTRNENGDLLVEFCNDTRLVIGGSLFPHKNCHKATWVSPDSVTENQIDHFCISRLWRRSLLDVRVKRSADIGSDHHLLVASVRLKVAAVKRQMDVKPNKKFDSAKLKSDKVREAFVKELKASLVANQQAEYTVDDLWNNTKEAYVKTSEKILGFRPTNKKPWMSEETWELIENRRLAKCARNLAKTRAQKNETGRTFNKLIKEVKKSCKRDKRAWYDSLAQKAEHAAASKNMKLLYEITRELAGGRHRQSRPIRDKRGHLLTSTEKQLDRWKEHFSAILNNDPPADKPPPTSRLPPTTTSRSFSLASQPPTFQETIDAILSLKNNKSPGYDGISAEMLKACPTTTAKILHPIFVKIWDEDKLPDDWLQGVLVTVPKKGDLSECRNYRGIMLLSTPSKVFTRLLLDRINKKLDSAMRRQQAGFRPHRSCVDQINTLRIIVEQSAEWRAALHLVFVDYSTAFDSIYRGCIWDALYCRGIAPKIIQLIKAQYDNFKCRVQHNGSLSSTFDSTSGVRQGCLISPMLFLIVLDDVLSRSVDGCRTGIQWNFSEHLEDLDYADDICLLSTKHSDMQKKLDVLVEESKKVGLKINGEKTKTLKINVADPCSSFSVMNSSIQNVNNFSYLGSVISKDGGAADDIQSRIAKARSAFAQLNKTWNSTSISTHTKLSIFNSNVKSVLLYGCETWLMTDLLASKLQSFVNKCLRRLLRIWWPRTISNRELWANCKQLPIQTEIKQRKWRWIGHTLRKDPTEICRQALDWNPQGSRKIGRPRCTWKRTLEKELKAAGKPFNEIKVIAKDRDRWKRFVEALCPIRDDRN